MWSKTNHQFEKELTLNLELFFGLESERKKTGKEQRSD